MQLDYLKYEGIILSRIIFIGIMSIKILCCIVFPFCHMNTKPVSLWRQDNEVKALTVIRGFP